MVHYSLAEKLNNPREYTQLDNRKYERFEGPLIETVPKANQMGLETASIYDIARDINSYIEVGLEPPYKHGDSIKDAIFEEKGNNKSVYLVLDPQNFQKLNKQSNISNGSYVVKDENIEASKIIEIPRKDINKILDPSEALDSVFWNEIFRGDHNELKNFIENCYKINKKGPGVFTYSSAPTENGTMRPIQLYSISKFAPLIQSGAAISGAYGPIDLSMGCLFTTKEKLNKPQNMEEILVREGSILSKKDAMHNFNSFLYGLNTLDKNGQLTTDVINLMKHFGYYDKK